MSATSIARIRELNDSFRSTFVGGAVMVTPAVQALAPQPKSALLAAVRAFDQFEDGDDPYKEHDFGSVRIDGDRFFWKVDYYDRALEKASPDPADPAVTTRVLTIMHASEY